MLDMNATQGVKLRVLHWNPLKPASKKPLIFVAGWVSVVSGWADFLGELVLERPVYYIETREKTSAGISLEKPLPEDFGMERIAEDLIRICSSLPVEMSNAIIAGSSFGATAILEALKGGRLIPRAAFLIGPNSEYRAPWFLDGLLLLPPSAYHLLKYIILWYIRSFRVDAVKEPEQMARYDETLRSAHPQRIKLSAKAAIKYSVWSGLETISIPVGLAYAPTDTLHESENIDRMAELLPKGKLIPCESNKYMHSAPLVKDIEAFISTIPRSRD